MKIFMSTIALTMVCAPVFASTSLKFVAANDKAETQVCLQAAQKGLQAADETAYNLGMSKSEARALICNGRTITSFSRHYQQQLDNKTLIETKIES